MMSAEVVGGVAHGGSGTTITGTSCGAWGGLRPRAHPLLAVPASRLRGKGCLSGGQVGPSCLLLGARLLRHERPPCRYANLIYGISHDLDAALSGAVRPASEQRKAVTPFVQRVLDVLTRKRPPGWIGAAPLLRDLSKEAQDELERNVRAAATSARRSGHAVHVHRHPTIGASRPYVPVATRHVDPPRAVAEEAEAELREQGPHSDEPLVLVHVTLPVRPAGIRALAVRPGHLAGTLGRSAD